MGHMYSSTVGREEERLDCEERGRFRKEVEAGQFKLFDDDINYAIKTRALYNRPEIVEAVAELIRRNGRKTPARAKPGRKLILVLTTGGTDA